jgi:hypothetical protein
MGPDFEIVKVLTELLDELDIGDYEVIHAGWSVFSLIVLVMLNFI